MSITAKEKILDMLLLEQFLVDMEESTQRWLKRHQLKFSNNALRLAEDFVVAEGEVYQEKPPKPTHILAVKEGE